VLGNLLETTSDPFGEAGFDKVLLAVFLEPLIVERILEMLKGESKVEDGYVGVYT
jgi:hypothetical protein